MRQKGPHAANLIGDHALCNDEGQAHKARSRTLRACPVCACSAVPGKAAPGQGRPLAACDPEREDRNGFISDVPGDPFPERYSRGWHWQ